MSDDEVKFPRSSGIKGLLLIVGLGVIGVLVVLVLPMTLLDYFGDMPCRSARESGCEAWTEFADHLATPGALAPRPDAPDGLRGDALIDDTIDEVLTYGDEGTARVMQRTLCDTSDDHAPWGMLRYEYRLTSARGRQLHAQAERELEHVRTVCMP